MQISRRRLLTKLSQVHARDLGLIAPILTSSNERYLEDWFGRRGSSHVVARPRSVDELRSILKYCHSKCIGVTTMGGNTGLVGATISGDAELVLSLDNLNSILEVEKASATTLVESGVVLEVLQDELSKHGLTTPYDLGARGSCTVGGNLATHAGGVNFLRHGPLRGHVIGIECVLADGTVIDSLSTSWKDNSGLDIKQLFIGSEGSLGIITKARLHCPPLPQYKSVAMLHSSKPFEESVLPSLMLARTHVGESLSAFEFFDSEAASILDPLPVNASKPGFTMIVEAAGAGSVQDRMESFVEALGEGSFDGIISQDLESMKRLWSFREHVPVKMAKLGPNLKFDLSLPQSEYYALVNLVREKYSNSTNVIKIVGYGHVGDGNLHLNIALQSACSDELKLEISEFVYGKVRAVNGSISAEHGIGRDKLAYIGFSKSESAIGIMRSLKHMFDPKGILNPGRTIPLYSPTR